MYQIVKNAMKQDFMAFLMSISCKNRFYFNELPYPTINTERIIVKIPITIVVRVFFETPFHSFRTKPHEFATKIMNAMCKIHELGPLPNLLSPMP